MASNVWRFVNKPIVANSAAVVLVGIIGYLFTSYFQCRTQSIADNIQLNDLFSEIVEKHNKLLSAIQFDKEKREELEIRFLKVKNALNPEFSFLFSENKGKSEAQLRREIGRIVLRWRVLPVVPKETRVSEKISVDNRAERCDVVAADSSIGIRDTCLSKQFEKFISPSEYLVDFRHWFEEAIDAEKVPKLTKDKVATDTEVTRQKRPLSSI